MNLAEAVEYQIFQKLASDASSAHHEHSRLRVKLVSESCIREKQVGKIQLDRKKDAESFKGHRN